MEFDAGFSEDLQKSDLKCILKSLVGAFDCPQGLPQDVYTATYDMLVVQMGREAGTAFANCIKATKDCFYFKDSFTCNTLLYKIFGDQT